MCWAKRFCKSFNCKRKKKEKEHKLYSIVIKSNDMWLPNLNQVSVAKLTVKIQDQIFSSVPEGDSFIYWSLIRHDKDRTTIHWNIVVMGVHIIIVYEITHKNQILTFYFLPSVRLPTSAEYWLRSCFFPTNYHQNKKVVVWRIKSVLIYFLLNWSWYPIDQALISGY